MEKNKSRSYSIASYYNFSNCYLILTTITSYSPPSLSLLYDFHLQAAMMITNRKHASAVIVVEAPLVLLTTFGSLAYTHHQKC